MAPLPYAFGKYVVSGILGRGGMGVVYAAAHRDSGAPVAVKTIRVQSATRLASFRREVHALRNAVHPGVVRIIEDGVTDGVPWYAMERVDGLTLSKLIRVAHWGNTGERTASAGCVVLSDRAANLSVPEPNASGRPAAPTIPGGLRAALTIVRKICTPLTFIHSRGIVHRDLKPDNVLIRPDGSIVLVDFGIAAQFGGARGREVLDVFDLNAGTFGYAAPEQLDGNTIDARADLYAVGHILYECITGQHPFAAASLDNLDNAPLPPSKLVEGISPELDALVLALLEKEPEHRLGYAEEVASVLERLGAEPDATAQASPEPFVYRSGFTGRQDVLAVLDSKLTALACGHGGVVTISGESGIGKTRLLIEVSRRAAQRGIHVITGEVAPLSSTDSEHHRGTPLHLFRRVLFAIHDRCSVGGELETERLLGDRGPLLAELEPAFARLPGQSQWPRPDPLPPAAALARSMVALRTTLHAFAQNGFLLLLLDDLQWADELSLAFLRGLSEATPSESHVLVVCCYRVEELSPELKSALGAASVEHLEIGRLGRGAVGQMVRGMLALRAAEPALLDFIYRKSAGNPFFIAEYLRAALTDRLLTRDQAGRWLLTSDVDMFSDASRSAPTTVVELIQRRLGALDESPRRIAQAAAVLGREFELELAAAVARLSGVEAMEAIEILRRRQIVEERESGVLGFVHDKLRETAYAELTPLAAAAMHRLAAESIEARWQGAPELARYYAALGHHYSRAGIHERAAPYHVLAADQARGVYANHEAIRFYRDALAEHAASSGRSSLDKSQVQEHLGDVLSLTGAHDEARLAFGGAQLFAEGDPIGQARLFRKLAKTWEAHHRHTESLEAYAGAEASLSESAVHERTDLWWSEWVQIQVEKAWVHYFMAQEDELSALIARARPVIEHKGTPGQRARFFQAMVNCNSRRERYLVSSETIAYARASMESAKASGEPTEIALAAFLLGFNLLWYGALDEAAEVMAVALRASERVGDATLRARCVTYTSVIYRRRREVGPARKWAQDTLSMARAGSMLDYVGVAEANLAWVAWHDGDCAATDAHARAAIDAWNRLPANFRYPLTWMARLPLIAALVNAAQFSEGLDEARALLADKQALLPDPLMSVVRVTSTSNIDDGERLCRAIVRAAVEVGFL